jgi:nitroreductase
LTLPFPDLGDPLPVTAEPRLLDWLARRRSSAAQTLGAPGPSAAQLADIIAVGARAPDHGKLSPWRFLVIEPGPKAALVERLKAVAEGQPNPDQARAKLAKLAAAPVTVAVISRPVQSPKVPEWEQVLSSGAVCTLMLVAAGAMGFGANWITDWYAYDAEAQAILGLTGEERVAGYIMLGTAREAPLERERPDAAALSTRWEG